MVRGKFLLVFALALILVVLLTGPAMAQSATARLEGVVTDASNAPLPGVTVTAANTATGLTRTDVTNAKGEYTITPLPVGPYRVRFELSGFKTAEVTATLTVGQVARVDMKMQLGGVSQTIEVVAAAPVIDKSTSEISTLVSAQQIENLPLNGRNFTQLATLVPGVTRGIPGSNAAGGSAGQDAETFRYSEFGGAALSVNGVREQFNNFLIEGLDNNESLVNTIAYLPPPEAIQEFSVITTNAPAEYGRAGGAIQNLVIKSGTNELKGSAYFYDRPKSAAATPAFATSKPDFNNRDFGLTAGGPIIHDRTFFFGSYHGIRSSIPVEAGNYVTVPTDKMRQGDFSELLDPKVSGLSAPIIIYNPVTGVPYPNNVIPPGDLNPVGKAYLALYPPATRAGVTHNYLTHRQRKSDYNDFDAKFDHTIGAADQLFVSGSDWHDQFSDPGRIPGFQAGFGAGTSRNTGYSIRTGETHVFSGDLVNEVRAGTTSFYYAFLPVGFGTDQDKAVGIPGINGVTTPNGISLIGGGDGTFIEYLGDFGQYKITNKTYQVADSVTWLRGSHSLKFGGNAIRRNLEQQRTQFGKGFYFFRTDPGPLPGYTGYEVSDMLVGITQFTTSAEPGFVPRNTISWENAVFAQDDWHVNPNLTLNLGLRWDLFSPYYEEHNRQANYNPVTGQLVLPDQNGATRSTLKTNYDNLGPRLGFNYLLTERTALRGAYGIFYALDRGGIDRQLTENPPAVITEFRFGPGGPTGCCIRLSDPIPLPTPVSATNPVLPQGSGVVYIPADSKNTQIQQWSIGAQHELSPSTSVMAAYVGTHADHLAANITAAGFAGDVSGRLSTTMYTGKSDYNAIQTQLRQNLTRSLSYLASYTYGHATNNTVGFFPGSPSSGGSLATDTTCVVKGTQNCNLNLDKGPADYDVRQRFTFAATWEIPFARDNPIAGGWSLNTVYTWQTGTPFTVYAGDGSGRRADMNGDPNSGPHTVDKYFNTAVFSNPKGAQGTEPRNAVRGPGVNVLDLSLSKNFRFPQRGGEFQLRVEGFNILDKPQYNIPNQFVGDSNFGKITGTRLNSERQVQLAARYIF